MRAKDLKALIENSGADVVETFRVELNNVPSDIKAMLDSVSRTQVRANVIPSQSQEVVFKDVKEFLNYFSTVAL